MSTTHKVAFSVEPLFRTFLPRIKYVLDFLSNHPNAPVGGVRWLLTDQPSAEMICVTYGQEFGKAGFQVPAQELILQHSPLRVASLVPKQYDFKEYALFSIEKLGSVTSASAPFVVSNGSSIRFGFDWVETLFFHLSRLEEYWAEPSALDEHGILPASQQFLPIHHLHHRPVVDHLVDAIYRAIGLTPQQRPTSWTITHDIDHVQLFSSKFKLWRYLGGMARRYGSLRGWLPLLRQYWACRWGGLADPYLDIEGLFAENPAVERVLYLAAVEEPYALDPSYRLKEPVIREIWERAAKLGYTLGVHPGYKTWRDAPRFQAALDGLQQWSGTVVRHTRQHYLRFAFPETPDIIEQTGVGEDSTLGYRDRIGFRCGTGFAYHLYDFAHEKPYTWLEKPLVVMDIALLREAAFNASAMVRLWQQFTQANQVGTHITVNFHNSVFFEPELHGLPLRHLYNTLIHNLTPNQP